MIHVLDMDQRDYGQLDAQLWIACIDASTTQGIQILAEIEEGRHSKHADIGHVKLL